MSKTYAIVAGSLVAVSLGVSVAAQQPRISNGRVTTQAAGSSLVQTFRTLVSDQSDVAWIGYSVPVVDSERVMCCFESGSGTTWINGTSRGQACCGGCRLEPSSDGTSMSRRPAPATGPVKLEGSDQMRVLFRIADRKVDRIRVFSEDCELDAGGRPIVWLDNVRPSDSIALLEPFATSDADGRTRIMEGAISAIALHSDPAADQSLERLAAATQPEPVRRKVTFWLGNARGGRGLTVLRRMLRDDPSIDVRKGAVFGVSQSHEKDAFDVLAALARSDQEPRIRSEAVFWIAQKGDARASAVILDALNNDASSEVRKKAVFALSQLKDNSGVEALVRVARTNQSPDVRSEAIFWLGQKAGRTAASAITERIEQDPDTEVKKKAVFALSQLPKDEGVPLLIKLARTHSNPAVRKQAMFWLGQSRDPRAIDFFAEVLKTK
jgi:HEAT repeat protein